jgi:hypothetical protein
VYKVKWKQYKGVSWVLVTSALVQKQFSGITDSRFISGKFERIRWREWRIFLISVTKLIIRDMKTFTFLQIIPSTYTMVLLFP